MIYCIWFPAGGFGHYVSAIISLYGRNFAKINHVDLEFSSTGDSHQYPLVAPVYFLGIKDYQFEFDKNKNYTVLIDNGIHNQSDTFKNVFPDAATIKICYSDRSWPIVARTMIEKAMEVNFDLEIFLDSDRWTSKDSWAYREKYFLFLRDHALRHSWRSQEQNTNLYVDDLLNYKQFHSKLQSLFEIESFEHAWNSWRHANKKYIDPIFTADEILKSIQTQQSLSIDYITDIWTQAVIYYYIWLTYNFEVPHNDYSDWFTNTADIVKMLEDHNITI